MASIYDNTALAYAEMPIPELMVDLLTHTKLLDTRISHIISKIRLNSIEHITLRQAGIHYVRQLIEQPESINTL
jgi:hypothetical protein